MGSEGIVPHVREPCIGCGKLVCYNSRERVPVIRWTGCWLDREPDVCVVRGRIFVPPVENRPYRRYLPVTVLPIRYRGRKFEYYTVCCYTKYAKMPHESPYVDALPPENGGT